METKIILEFVLQVFLIGIGATIVMDAWLLLLIRSGALTMNFALLGRWIGDLMRGEWLHDSITIAVPVRREVVLGWSTHYATGIVFAALLLLVEGPDWARAPTLLPALITGAVTVSAPLLVVQPALGLGIASSRTRTTLINSLRSVVSHLVFGVGLYVAAVACAHVRSSWV
jgi:hypothetical protein